MVCDMLDGKVARLTKTDGAFGAELDSLSDVVSFGVAPAILAHRLLLDEPGVFGYGERLVWFITVFYPVMAAIRLARYNVEHTDEALPYFRGLPSPGAAAMVCACVFLHCWYPDVFRSAEKGQQGLESLTAFDWSLVGISVLVALLMVSTVHFPHVGNTLLGRLNFRKLIILMMLGAMFVMWFPIALASSCALYLGYGLAGEGVAMWRKWRQGRNPLDDPEDDDAEDVGIGGEKESPTGPASGR